MRRSGQPGDRSHTASSPGPTAVKSPSPLGAASTTKVRPRAGGVSGTNRQRIRGLRDEGGTCRTTSPGSTPSGKTTLISRWLGSDGAVLAGLVAVFGISRLCYHALGVRFDLSPLGHFWQYADPALLHARPVETLVNLHTQPPLFNAMLALGLRASDHELAFNLLYLAAGMVLTISLYRLQRRLGVRRWLSAVVTLALAANPTTVLYENLLFYSAFVPVLLVTGTLFLHRFASGGRRWHGVAAFGLFAVLALMRSLFHLLWLLIVLLIVLTVLSRRRWEIVLVAAVPVLMVTAWYGKNAVMFESFSASTWSGMSLSKLTTFALPPDESKGLVAEGVLSHYALMFPFQPLEAYGSSAADQPPRGIPVLDQLRKSTGAYNLNHAAYLTIARHYGEDALTVLVRRPAVYLASLQQSWCFYFRPADQYWLVYGNRAHIAGLSKLYDRFVGWQLQTPADERMCDLRQPSTLATFSWSAVAIFFALPVLMVGLWRRENSPWRVTLLVAVFSVLFVAAVGNGVELGENNRFRFEVEPLAAVAVVALGEKAVGHRDRARPAFADELQPDVVHARSSRPQAALARPRTPASG